MGKCVGKGHKGHTSDNSIPHPPMTASFRPCLLGVKEIKTMTLIDATVYFLQRSMENERQYTPVLMNKEEVIVIPRSLQDETKYFSEEVEVLKNAFPDMAKALEAKQPYTIEMTLQEISQLFPGRRVRLDAYTRLTRYLATQQITLNLTSKKTKKVE